MNVEIPVASLVQVVKQHHHQNGFYDPDPDFDWRCRLCSATGEAGLRAQARAEAAKHLVAEHGAKEC